MNPMLREALDRRDPEAIIAVIEDDPHLDDEGREVVEAWAWIESTPHASDFARSLLRALRCSVPALRVPAGWVSATGLTLAERAMETVDDADGPTSIYGTLVIHDPMNEVALDHWIEQVMEGDGYFDPESLYRAHTDRFQPDDVPAQRRRFLRAIEVLASFSLNVGYDSRSKALEYLARDLGRARAPVSPEAVTQAMERLGAVGGFRLPSAEELAAALPR